jgi:enamine deaminase RidA (YjgF/YER057c/UK114 family)
MPPFTLPLDRPHRTAGRAGSYVFVGGAGDHDATGAIRHPGDLAAQIAGAIANIAAALDSGGCTLADVVRLKAFYTGETADEWAVLAALANAVGGDPPPAITTNPVPMQPWPGQLVQVQAIASRGWRAHPQTRAVVEDVPAATRNRFDFPRVTAGLRAGELLAVPGRTAAAATDDVPADPVAQTDLIMGRMGRVLGELGASFQDAIKMEGYYFGSTFDEWAPLAQARARHFREPGPVATVVPCHELQPAGTRTKVEVLGLRDHWNGFDKYIPREDRWPRQVWDWPIPLPYRQGIRLREMIWTGGQVPYEPDANRGRTVFSGELEPQALFTIRLVEDILRAFGATAADLALLVCYFTSDGSPAAARAFADLIAAACGGVLPPVTLVPQPAMHDAEMLVEIWGVAQA